MQNLAVAYYDLGMCEDALKLRKDVLAHRQRTLPKDHPDNGSSMSHLAFSYLELGRYADAMKL